jgi:hypothetical protein
LRKRVVNGGLRACLFVAGLLGSCGVSENAAPLASATCGTGTHCLVLPNGDATLDARGSSDPDGDVLAFRWSPVDSASLCVNPVDCPCGWTTQEFTGFIRDTGSAMTTFRAPAVVGAQLVFHVEVSDTEHTAEDCSIYFVAEF